jgi:AcrR family transcriptional regulator
MALNEPGSVGGVNQNDHSMLGAAERALECAVGNFDLKLPKQSAKSEILFNAVGVFVRKGLVETTVQDLLDAAKISRRTFYKYFKNKVDVLVGIYQVASDILMVRFRMEMEKAETAGDFMRRCVDLYLDYHANLGPLVRMMTQEALRHNSPLAARRNELIDGIVELLDEKHYEVEGVKLDRQVFHVLIWMIESASLHLLTKTDCAEEDLSRIRCVLGAVASRVLITDERYRPNLPLRQSTE